MALSELAGRHTVWSRSASSSALWAAREAPWLGRREAAGCTGFTCGPNALLGHHSAAWLWGTSTRRTPAPFAITVPTPRSPRPPIEIHRARNLTAEDRAVREGIPITAVARTLLDLAAAEAVLARNAGRPGVHRLRQVLAIYRRPPLHSLGVGAPLPRARPRRRAATASSGRDRARQMVRVTAHRLDREPRTVIQRVAALLGRRRSELRSQPPLDGHPIRLPLVD